MKTVIATALTSETGTRSAEVLVQELRAQLGDAAPAFVVVFASTAQPLEPLQGRLLEAFGTATVLGASTAGEFTEKGDAKQSVCAFALAGDFKVFAGMGSGLRANPEQAVRQALEALPTSAPGYPHRTGVLLLDPLAGNGEEVTLLAASMLGDQPLAGGAAGDDLQMKATSVGCGSRAASDAVVIAQVFSKSPLGLGVCHGHTPVSKPLKVTSARGNVVETIDERPAWDVWLENTLEREERRGVDQRAMTREEEGGYLLRYEAGIATGSAYKVRAPLSRDERGAISFACGVPQGTVFRITESAAEPQIASAREAARRARVQLAGGSAAGALVFDCICRNLILGEGFDEAVRGMSAELGGAPICGFETYGEIALDAGDMSGFHNTTTVVLAFPR